MDARVPNEDRPDPDALLAAVQKDMARQQRGKLKIFLGMAAGVGKTYAMLEAAHEARAGGVDVVVGVVETHGRAETQALLGRLEIMPRLTIDYRGANLEEMDLDALRKRQPQVVLVDELAHTNAPGSRHAKRFQDVLELLEAGIDVWTTVNVQHFDSRADSVRQITGITVQETIPDTLLELANEVELIDLSPEELRKRLAEGKVYTPERSEIAARNFFRMGNLTALREMALRLTAEHVDHQLQDYMQLKRIAGPWKSGERLMVAVGSSPFSERLIRWTRRMAYSLEAPWLAVHVETTAVPSTGEQEFLARNLALARTLGAEVMTTTGRDVVDGLLRVARQRNVTQIVAGKPLHAAWRGWMRGGSLVDGLLRAAGNFDVYVVSSDQAEGEKPRRPMYVAANRSSMTDYGRAFMTVLLATLISFLATPWVSYLGAGMIELLAVLLIAVYIGRGPAVMAAALSALSWNFIFIEPRFTFDISQPQDILLFLLYFAIAIFAGNMTARIRQQERLAQANADRTTALYTLAHETATAVTMDGVLHTAITQLNQVFVAQAAIFLSHGDLLNNKPHPASIMEVDERDYSVAVWVFENGKPAGRFTETLPSAGAQFLPLRTPNRTVGVLGVRLVDDHQPSFDERMLLETFASQIALGIEREMLGEAAEQSAMLHESERLYTTLLNSISHELRTPIATIRGAASSLRELRTWDDTTARQVLIDDIGYAAKKLNRLVENLLDMSRLESGRLSLKKEWCDVSDVIGVAVKQVEECLGERPLLLEIRSDLALVQMDFVLIEQVLVNLLDNICSHTPVGTEMRIAAARRGRWLEIQVADNGPGIPESEIEHIFDKFFRLPGSAGGGTGLGLSICRGLVEAHGGTLTAGRAPEGGALFTVRLPSNESPPPAREAEL